MKLQPDKFDVTSVSGYGPDWIAVNGEKFKHSLVLALHSPPKDWGCASYADLTEQHFGQLADSGAELIVFGSGSRLRFPKPEWLRTLMARRIGVETMDTQAACRTFNILASENRNVVAVLLLEPGGTPLVSE
jgi:uncharacterized protein